MIGLWIGTDHDQGSVSVAFISPWMSGGNLLDFVRQNKDTSSHKRLWFVSYRFRFCACALADPFTKLYNVASALSYSKPSSFYDHRIEGSVLPVHNHPDGEIVHGDLKAVCVLYIVINRTKSYI